MKEQYESIARMCQELLNNGPVDTELGICNALSRRNEQGYYKVVRLIDEIIKTWPKFSGSVAYPVPCDGSDYTCPADCFNSTDDLWEGTQGDLRYELLQFIIQQCERRLLDLSFPVRDIGPFRALLVE